MRIRVTDFLGIYPAIVMAPCAAMCFWGAFALTGDLMARLITLLLGIGMVGVCISCLVNYVEVEWGASRQQEPPEEKKEQVPRPEVAPVKRDRYEIIKVGA